VVCVLCLFPTRARAQGVPLSDPEAIALARDAVTASKESHWDECIAKDKASLQIEDNARTRLHLAICESKVWKLIDALRHAQEALVKGMETNDELLMKIARERVMDLVQRVPKVTFEPPAGVTDLKVTFDDREVAIENLRRKFSVEPGKHVVKASGVQSGVRLTYTETLEIMEGQTVSVVITLKSPEQTGFLPEARLNCLRDAKSQKEVEECFPKDTRPILARVNLDMAGYTDSTAVHVFSPSVGASVNSPTAGWNFGATYMVDFVTAASPDVVSTASRRFREQRHAVTGTAGYKPKSFGVQAFGALSTEPDTLSTSFGGAISTEVNDKRITPRLAFTHRADVIGRNDTPFNVWSHYFRVEEFDASSSFVLTPTAVVVAGLSVAAERGDQSKPYRFIPTFEPQYAKLIPPGASPDLVNVYRAAARPREQVPTERDRYSVGFRLAKRLTVPWNATLRLEERLYADTWNMFASSTDARYMVDASRFIRLWPHFRFHVQNGASFYKLAYPLFSNPQTGQISAPTFRTTDRELAPMRAITGGGGARVALSKPEASTQTGITLTVDAMYSQYTQSLFINFRTSVYGALSFDAEF
jgi:hypothetical protein